MEEEETTMIHKSFPYAFLYVHMSVAYSPLMNNSRYEIWCA